MREIATSHNELAGYGFKPVWPRGGTEVFFPSHDGMMLAVEVAMEPDWMLSAPIPLFPNRSGTKNHHDVSSDGQRFLTIVPTEIASGDYRPRIHVVLNWFEELKRLVPTGR